VSGGGVSGCQWWWWCQWWWFFLLIATFDIKSRII
jgi:hypothetical protein